jgi:phosphatidate cytidylyltransferase
MSDLAVRALTGAIMIVVALLSAYVGGTVFAWAVAAIATLMFYEWTLLPALALLWIRERDVHGLYLLLWTFIVTWSTDIGAYFAGRSLGRRKLAPTISPNKTVEGLFGGIAAATLLGGAWALATGLGVALLALAPVLAVAAQAGDLFESGMKRRAGVKDSGTWLPGHGGALDRLDGLVPVAVLTAAAQLVGLT